MSAISDFAAKQNEFNTRQGKAIDGLVVDLEALNKKIDELQNTPGTITPQDQALLDDIQAKSSALADRLDQLDAQTPPVVPPTP